MNFIDEVKISVQAGDGGNGCSAFRREKHVPKGGPSGGDGGNGGSIILIGDLRKTTLFDFKYKKHYKAKRGMHGEGRDKYGKAGEDLILKVPVGTMVFDEDTGELLGDITKEGEKLIVAKGGRGGFGNIHYVSSTNQAPLRADPGRPGEYRNLRLELKLLADVGLLGLPNAGKSTLLSIVSKAKPKIANYPFTTLIPNLGVVEIDEERRFVMADIPGLVEGAHKGKGLGHRFLKHLERTSLLLHLIEYPINHDDVADPAVSFQILNRELKAFDPKLATLPVIVVMTKIDLCHDKSEIEKWRKYFSNYKFHTISSVTKEGLKSLYNDIWHTLHPSDD